MTISTFSLLTVWIVCGIHLTHVESQCTTEHRENDNDFSILAAIFRLQHTMRRKQQHCKNVLVRQQNEFKEALEQYQKQLTAIEKFLKRRLPPRDCYEILMDGQNVSGVYNIYVPHAGITQVYCDMETDGGGWLVFQRRLDGSIDFYLDWADYKVGFGDVAGEFWLGNDYLHEITSQARYTLRVDLEDFENDTRHAVYSSCAIASEGDKYRLSLGSYSGTAGDSLTSSAGHAFTTRDQDNDVYDRNCAQVFKGAWWFVNCHHSDLNALYLRGPYTSFADGVVWKDWHGFNYSLKKTEMKLRPRSFRHV